MIIFASIISQLPTTMASLGSTLFTVPETGPLNLFGWLELPVNPVIFWILLGFVIALIIVIYFLVKLNEAQRIITINYAKRVHGNTSYGGIKSLLPIKLIAAGVIPVIFATAFLSLPALIGQVITTVNPGNEIGATLTNVFTAPSANNFLTNYPDGITGQWFIYPALYFVLVVAFTFFYTSIIFNTKEIADNLQKQGGFIEGVRPGITTANYLSKVVNRLNLFGALALGLIAMLPFITDYVFIAYLGYPIGLSISGTGLLIVVTVALENLRSLDSRALMVTYDDYSNEEPEDK
jgi:preprotein translocase subunit SecY